MKSMIPLGFAVSLGTAALAASGVPGFDVSHYQPNVDMKAAYAAGARFVIIKATEGTSTIDASFSQHYEDATAAGLIRGGYHFAHPGVTSGASQANYFLAHGGGWSADGITLPGMLDLESESSGECWGLSASAMVSWIKDFSNTYHSKTGRYPMLYAGKYWWQDCTGNSNAFVNTNPLVLPDYSSTLESPPGSWPYATIWQNSDSYKYGGDSDYFQGTLANLQKLAKGS